MGRERPITVASITVLPVIARAKEVYPYNPLHAGPPHGHSMAGMPAKGLVLSGPGLLLGRREGAGA